MINFFINSILIKGKIIRFDETYREMFPLIIMLSITYELGHDLVKILLFVYDKGKF